jgi:hypothetical protein
MERKRSHLMLNEIKSEINSDNGFDTKSEVIYSYSKVFIFIVF